MGTELLLCAVLRKVEHPDNLHRVPCATGAVRVIELPDTIRARRIDDGAKNLTLESLARLANLFEVGLDELSATRVSMKTRRGRLSKKSA